MNYICNIFGHNWEHIPDHMMIPAHAKCTQCDQEMHSTDMDYINFEHHEDRFHRILKLIAHAPQYIAGCIIVGFVFLMFKLGIWEK